MNFRFSPCLMAAMLSLAGVAVRAQDVQKAPAEPAWDARFQLTYVNQSKAALRSPYAGAASLRGEAENSYTFSATAFLGMRVGSAGELYFNPEAVQGRALSQVRGLGGLTSGELQKTAGPNLRAYRARLFYRHTVGLGGGTERIEADANQLATTLDRRRLQLTVGNLAVTDIFGTSDIAGDARSQFLNWSSLTWGHYDFAADARGYSTGAAAELTWDDWSVRAGRFMLPREPNQLALDGRIMRHHGDQLEIERRHGEGGSAGTVKALVFRNATRMAGFADNLPLPCDLSQVGAAETCVRGERSKVGWGLQLEQSLGPDVRVLLRGGRSDGRSETYAFADIDHSLFAAARLGGALWGHADQHVGLSLAQNGLSASHREFLRLGGIGAFVGDGRLSYRPERILEVYWSVPLQKVTTLTLGWQHIANPGYNADRGPVNVGTLRLHAEF